MHGGWRVEEVSEVSPELRAHPARARLAGAEGARTVELTSRPDRAAANRLYQGMGFALRDTNVYRFTAPPRRS